MRLLRKLERPNVVCLSYFLCHLLVIDLVSAVSSCQAGTVLTGLSVIKDQPDPVALPDDQYPAWLWTILDDSATKLEKDKKLGQADAGSVDFKLEKKRLRSL